MKILTILFLNFLLTMGQPIYAQTMLAKQSKSASDYQKLIQKVFELRKKLNVLEEKHIELENERSVLIFHVKELQEIKDSRSQVIQNLKNMVASLRIEMLKDPKMTKTIDSLNQRIKQANEQRDASQKKADQLELEKEELAKKIGQAETLLLKEKEATINKQNNNAQVIKQAEAEIQLLIQELEQARQEHDKQGNRASVSLEKSYKNKAKELTGELELVRRSLKDTEETLNAQIRKKEEKSQRLQDRIDQMGEEKVIRDKEITKLKKVIKQAEAKNQQLVKKSQNIRNVGNKELNLEKRNAKRESELQTVSALLEKAETDLNAQSKKVQSLDRNFKNKTKKLNNELEEAHRLLAQSEQEIKLMKKEQKDGNDRLKNDVKQLDKEKSELEKVYAKLKKRFEKADGKNQKLDEKIEKFENEVQEGEKINRQLMADLKKEQSTLRQANKRLKKEKLKSVFEREHYEEQLKFARVDKALFETKIQELQERALIAETKHSKIEEELEVKAAKVLLREAEALALKKEKTKLEKKLIRYIGKTGDRQDVMLSASMRSGEIDWNRQGSRLGKELKTKKEVAQKKLNIHYNLALAYDKRKMYKAEESEYHKCLKINAQDANVHYNLAILYDDKLNRNMEAIKHYKKFLELHPSGEGAYQVKEWLLHAEQEERLDSRSH